MYFLDSLYFCYTCCVLLLVSVLNDDVWSAIHFFIMLFTRIWWYVYIKVSGGFHYSHYLYLFIILILQGKRQQKLEVNYEHYI